MEPKQVSLGAVARLLAGAVAVLAVCMSPTVLAAGERPGPERFFQNATMVGASLSPDGKTLLILSAPSPNGHVRLLALRLESMKATLLAQYDRYDVENVHWVNNHRVVYGLDDHQAPAGDRGQPWGPGLWGVDIDGSRSRQLVARSPDSAVRSSTHVERLSWTTRYVAAVDSNLDSDDIFVAEPALYDYSGIGDYKLRRVNTATGRTKDIGSPTGATLHGWIFDHDANPRVSVVLRGSRTQVMLRDPATDNWSAISDADSFVGGDGFSPLALLGDDQLLVMANQGRDTRSIYKYDLKTRTLRAQPFLQSDRYDLDPEVITQAHRLLGLRYQLDASSTHWLEPAMAALQDKIDAILPSTINEISVPAGAADSGMVLLRSFSDRAPQVFYLYDTKLGKLVELGSEHPEVDPDRMSSMEPVHYPARDGLEIPAWLTVPQGKERKNLPLVVLVHGGPFMRGQAWRWDAQVQFLAARGYAVLEPEFRGSMGYGDKLFRAGFKQWGLGMQNDLADGVKWAVGQGWVDARRVCIAGGSYGGFAVLMGLINDPEVYRCGIDWAGPTDIDLMYTATWSDASDAFKKYGMPRLIGDPVADAAQLRATSPILNAGKIKAPLLMAYGGEDFRVPIEHGEKMLAALKRQSSADVEWVVYGDEGHGWRAMSTRIDFWNRVASFLDKNIGPN